MWALSPHLDYDAIKGGGLGLTMNFINFGQWGLVLITYFGTSQNDLFSAELAMHVRYKEHRVLETNSLATL